MSSDVQSNGGWIEFKDLSAVESDYREAFAKAREKLNAVLARQPHIPVNIEGRAVRGVLIDASTRRLDGPQGILGRAGPTYVRTNTGLPVTGVMEFDNQDLTRLKEKGELEDVILHEMFHVLGAGTLWLYKSILTDDETDNPKYVGASGLAEYHTLLDSTEATYVPVANTGGPGTRNGHWRETTFGTELNTGFLNGAHRPLSRMSIAALSDLGYSKPVLEEADPYALPDAAAVGALRSDEQCCMKMLRPDFHEVIEV